MKWIEDYATGIAHIDEQHKMLFQMSDDFHVALDEGGGVTTYTTLLETLALYCRGHFRLEERCMEEYRCPVAQSNKEAHVKLVAVLGGFQRRYAECGYQTADAYELVATLDQWLSKHICGIDIHLKDCVRNRQE